MQKKLLSIMLSVVFLAMGTLVCQAQENKDPAALAKESAAKAQATADKQLTPTMIKQKVRTASQLLEEKGEAAFPEFQGKDSKFIFAGTYIWIHDMEGVMRMHPIKYKLNGNNVLKLKDPNGKMLFAEMNSVCEEQGSGWVYYHWPKPGESEASPKISFVKLAEHGNNRFVVGCGTYDSEVIKQVRAKEQ